MPESIIVIGCGPGGMFFCHALETKYRELIETGDTDAIANLPEVTVFERAGSPGGVWRANRNISEEPVSAHEEKKENELEEENESTQMYEALWTNGPKEGVEFFDYTYDDHFGKSLPVYMPRQALLEYMSARVTRNCPEFFEKYVTFNTNVSRVVFNDDTQNFTVTIEHLTTGAISTNTYDRCIWAAGECGLPSMPQTILQSLNGFSGRVIHSTATSNFKNDVFGKRILIVGGSFSAEDLGLMACKVGVEQAYIASRADDSVVSWMRNWPGDKVECLLNYQVLSTENSSTILLQKVQWVCGETYEPVEDEEPLRLENIDTVMLCTGYKMQFGMLEPRLQQWSKKDLTRKFKVPDDWMVEDNAMNRKVASKIGEIPKPKEALWFGSSKHFPDLYNGILIDNPKMMFLHHSHDDYPILNHDAMAYLFLQYTTGARSIPTKEEMRNRNLADALLEMSRFPLSRYYMDEQYFKALKEFSEKHDSDYATYWEAETHHSTHDFRLMARAMEEGNYPAGIGTFEELNKRGGQLVKYGMLSYYHRSKVPKNKTFRDVQNANRFKSFFTGTSAVPLKKLWMDIDEKEDKDLW
mmetsp:Transcript_5423/g.7846  ORF Transcript_5423/g.7846 Transcript_5423/m.7846 type:complete len:583 (+) Transcript_5423:136-1884(+)|eukprot:CAMPEP_0194199436 /NCGR_PEP_ID=MMETSP0156-20130528/453_1 /TAXON_ID=33649 /ORGANISM="Thalassionema nitzschioides, Strain L26-B" /LENGTH=582 /DNA_ID=CAMNT_0038924329 /DNA_START=94 /DNA_END=1842 /DNA_ORIENTATION=-